MTWPFPSPHLRPDEVMSVAESLGDVTERTELHLRECAECRNAVETIRETIAVFRTEDAGGIDRQANFVDWNGFQASVRERLLARSVRRDSWVRRWTGVPAGPGPATAWAAILLVVVSVLVLGNFSRFVVGPSAPAPPTPESAATASPGSWIMIEEPEALEIEAIAWAEADIFSTIDELDSGEEERLRALLLEASDSGNMDLMP